LSTLRSHSGVEAGVSALALLGWGVVYAGLAFGNLMLSMSWLKQAPAAPSVAADQPVVQLSGRDKRRLVAAARQPGASIASIAQAHRISVHRLQRWIDILERAGKLPKPQECHRSLQ
ncbi:hypothetical protein DBR42_03760, partial [Pelomonas sp. HMWF004]